MPAFLIIYVNVTNPEQFKKYAEAVIPAISRRGGKLTAFGQPDVVEGDFPWHRALIFEWPSKKDALDA
jgi:uncharacterized protein (DUF1330 family)